MGRRLEKERPDAFSIRDGVLNMSQKIQDAANRYMVEMMGFQPSESQSDQEANQTLRHLVQFGYRLLGAPLADEMPTRPVRLAHSQADDEESPF